MAASNNFILLTGASGFVGNHTLATFLAHGYRVRVVARNQSSCDRMVRVHAASTSKIETCIVPDITQPGAFDEAVKDVDGIVHMASPYVIKVADNEKDLILPALNGTRGILESARRFGRNVRRVVITSSFAAVSDFSKGLWPGHTYEETQWNPLTYEQTRDDQHGLAYAGSRKLAEESAWSFMRSHTDLPFTLATINPVMISGPVYPGTGDLKHLGTSLGSMYQLMTAGLTSNIPPTHLPFFVDVRDVAEAHRLAFELEASTNPGRFLISSGKYSNEAVCGLWETRLGMHGKVPGTAGFTGPPESYNVDATRAKEILKLGFRSFEECFGNMGKSLQEMQAKAEGQS